MKLLPKYGPLWKISTRSLLKNKTLSLISITGLALGFTAFIIIGLFIIYEFNWDTHNEHYDRIHRVQRHYIKTSFAMDGNDISPHSSAITASLLEQYPEIEKVTVLRENLGKHLSRDGFQQFYDETGICADTNFFSVFTYHFVEGANDKVIDTPFTIVLSKSMADKLFNGETALGRTVTLEKKYELKVMGVYADLPINSTLRPSYIVSFSTLERTDGIKRDDLYTGDCMNYALLKPGVDHKVLEQKIKNLFKPFKYFEFEELQLCPMSMLHISFNGRKDFYVMLGIFGLIALFILLMSAFNYINLTIANASTRGKEVAVKKLNGSKRKTLIIQFLGESIFQTFIASVFALILVKIILPVYNTIVNTGIEFDPFTNWQLVSLILLLSLVIGFISGIYPAFLISSHQVVDLFKKGMTNHGNNGINVRRLLVSFQFAISIVLICLSLFFVVQLNYMTTKHLGFEKQDLLYVKLSSSETGKKFDDLRERVLHNPEIIEASMSKNLPFVNLSGGMINWEGSAPDEKISYRPNEVSFEFVKNMGITILDGRDFSRQLPSDIHSACLINEAALKCFNWDNPIGKRINNNKWTVVGVVKDYYYKDMHNHIEPAVLVLASGEMNGDWSFAFRYNSGSREKARKILESTFAQVFPNDPFEFHDLAEAFHNESTIKLYQSIKKSILFFTAFNIFLAIIGLFGLVSFATLRRTKEIGVRKINGGSVGEIFLILNREFFVLLCFSLILAWPIAYMVFMTLPGANRIGMNVWIWIPPIAALVAFIIVVATTSLQTYRAATRNPVEALRYE
jgi:putative ABC transport system permease protein